MTDSAGHHHRVEYIGVEGQPITGMLTTTDGQRLADADYDWRSDEGAWWLRSQVTRAYSEGVLTMEMRATYDGPQIIESAALFVPKKFFADAISVFLPKRASAQDSDCNGELIEFGMASLVLGKAMWEARKQPYSWRALRNAAAALTLWYAMGDAYFECYRASRGGL